MLKPGVHASLVRGLEQWLWFLGADARHPENNLLLRYGCVKFKPPGTGGSSRYRLARRDHCIELHSCCVGLYSEVSDGFIFIRARHQCFLYTAQRPPFPGHYTEEDLIAVDGEETSIRFHVAARRFLEWLEKYERWVDQVCSSEYRARCYEAYHLKWCPPSIGRAWFEAFCHEPHLVTPLVPVVRDMALLESHTHASGKHALPSPLPDRLQP